MSEEVPQRKDATLVAMTSLAFGTICPWTHGIHGPGRLHLPGGGTTSQRQGGYLREGDAIFQRPETISRRGRNHFPEKRETFPGGGNYFSERSGPSHGGTVPFLRAMWAMPQGRCQFADEFDHPKYYVHSVVVAHSVSQFSKFLRRDGTISQRGGRFPRDRRTIRRSGLQFSEMCGPSPGGRRPFSEKVDYRHSYFNCSCYSKLISAIAKFGIQGSIYQRGGDFFRDKATIPRR